MTTYKIVGGPLPWDIKVLDPDGKEMDGVTEVSFGPISPTGDPVKAQITVQASLDVKLQGDVIEERPPDVLDEMVEALALARVDLEHKDGSHLQKGYSLEKVVAALAKVGRA